MLSMTQQEVDIWSEGRPRENVRREIVGSLNRWERRRETLGNSGSLDDLDRITERLSEFYLIEGDRFALAGIGPALGHLARLRIVWTPEPPQPSIGAGISFGVSVANADYRFGLELYRRAVPSSLEAFTGSLCLVALVRNEETADIYRGSRGVASPNQRPEEVMAEWKFAPPL